MSKSGFEEQSDTEYESESEINQAMSDESDEPGSITFAINDMKVLKEEINNYFSFNHGGIQRFVTKSLTKALNDIAEKWDDDIYADMLADDVFLRACEM